MEIKEVKSFRVVFTLKLTLRYQTLILHDKNSGCLLIPKNSHALGIPPFLCATKGCPLPSQNPVRVENKAICFYHLKERTIKRM